MHRIAATGWEIVPVVSRQNIRELEGTISVSDILAAYAHEPAAPEPDEKPAAIGRVPREPLVKALTALALVVILAGTLNYFFRTARKGQAEAYFQSGNRLAAQHRYDEAVEQYRKALSFTPNAERRLALGLVLLNTGDWNEATTYLKEVLREQPQNGPANLGIARVLAHQGRINEAATSYRRAANGFWPDQPRQHRAEARLELSDVLAKAGRRTEAAGELLSLAAQSQENPAIQERAGRALLDLGMPQEATDLFADMAQRNRQSATAYAGLGEARFRAADYAGAQVAFHTALRINPGDPQAASRLSECEMILALDPTVRGLRPAERLRRSRTLLVQNLDDFSHCATGSSALPPKAKSATEAARAALSHPRRRTSEQDAEQANLALAEQLWSERLHVCSSKPPDTPLARVMSRITNQ
jgi:tetratricopeptide (TPR) repeat protein